MKSFAVDSNNDLFLDRRGNIAMSYDLDAVMQNLEHIMQSVLGEMVLALGRGLPYFETVWTAQKLRLFETYARRRLLAEPGVEAVEHFSASQEGDVLRYHVIVRTAYGQGVLNSYLQLMRGA